jgi:hypothetical protein
MRVRKSFSRMPQPEREAFLAALLQMKNTIAKPLEPDTSKHISIYDQFVLIHNAADAGIQLSGATAVDPAHQGSAFGPWHREFLLRFELELQKFDPTVMLPYWDWTDGPGNMNIIFNEFGMGPDGNPADGDRIGLGYFSYRRPGTGSNTTPLPPWYPGTMNGWHCDPRLVISAAYNDLRRNRDPFGNLATPAHVRATLDTPTVPPATDALTYMAFRGALEAGTRMHNAMHNWFGTGSHMRSPNQSPNDPMFFLHHCNCDRLWAMWQMDGHEGTSFYQVSGGFEGHNLANPMWPWVGGLSGYTSSYVTGSLVIPDFSSETPRTASDVIDHRNIVLNGVNVGYSYDSQVVVGIALDRTGSMTGPTPDPLTGMPPNITKWDAAKLGVGHFLQDAEAAYQATESYVVGGVNTFRSFGANEVLPVSGATPPYGLIKNGSPYDQASFASDISGVIAQGGTPLAAALSDTEDGLVRPPFGGKPDGEQRYMCILTDGIETSPPLLSTLGAPEFPDTIIFGLGFGVGGGWNGVDYTTIATMVSKGKSAPVGVQQVFNGENANVIDKFYTNSIAHTLGFSPVIDPRFEIFPGEFVMAPFVVACGDQSFMITVQGFDFNDKHWAFHLMGPDGAMYMKPTRTPYFITMVRRDARLTAFLNRACGPTAGWEGTWNVMAQYMPGIEPDFMYMPYESELVIHTAAPPLLGPLYTRYDQPSAKRTPVRLMQPKRGERHPHFRGYETGEPSTVAVNVYSKGHLSATVEPRVRKPFAGNPIELAVNVNDLAVGKIEFMRVTGRLIAPNYSLGNILLDFETISKSKRKKYVQRESDDESTFDLLAYLADYEKAKPGAFDLRDDTIEFVEGRDGVWTAMIKETPFPGVYRIGVQVEGSVVRADGCTERLWRVLNTEVALGIDVNEESTDPKLDWVEPNKLVVRFRPADVLGNLAVPGATGAVQLLLARRPIAFVQRERDDGTIELEATAGGQGVKIDGTGRYFGKDATFDTPDGCEIEVKAKTPLKFSVRVGSSVVAVPAPR